MPLSIALIAACLMLSGVSKSGSPAPSPITSRPAALSARALSVTAMVADGLMRLSDSASTLDGEAGLSWTAGMDMGISVSPHVGASFLKRETADGKPQSPSLAKVCMCNGFVGPGHPAVH